MLGGVTAGTGAMLSPMSLGDIARRFIPLGSAPAVPPPAPLPPPSAPPVASRFLEARVSFREMLWHPVIGLAEAERLICSAKAGLPHCSACDKPFALAGDGKDWTCPACHESRPAADVDFFAMDQVIAEALVAFLREHPDFAPAPGLSVSARALQALQAAA